MANIIEISGIIKRFGGLVAVDNLSFNVEEGEILSIIGPNGAGKTTLFNLITNVFPTTAGNILFRGRSISGMPSHKISALGIARTFQNVGLFKEMTALENIMVGLHGSSSYGFISAALKLPWVKKNEAVIREHALKAIETIHLEDKAHMLAANLSFGDQKLLEFGRAMAIDPSLLLLDEPGAGLNQTEKEDLIQLILEISKQGITVLLVEHDMGIVMRISNRVVVLNFGVKIAEGGPEEISRNTEVIKAYLGEDLSDAQG